VDPRIVVAVFPIIFIGELPDKTMFASLVLATRGRALSVWFGAAFAFLLHVVIAVTIGVGLFKLLPTRLVDAIVAVLFLVGAVSSWRMRDTDESELVAHEVASHRRVATTAFTVVFIAEWGDLTQVLTANLAARYHSPLSVALGSALALWSVAALAVLGGRGLMAHVNVTLVRRITAVVLVLLAIGATWSAIRA
jgi:putative Ca2+/H+ antiporter (TMEM165/GDT1 family)